MRGRSGEMLIIEEKIACVNIVSYKFSLRGECNYENRKN